MKTFRKTFLVVFLAPVALAWSQEGAEAPPRTGKAGRASAHRVAAEPLDINQAEPVAAWPMMEPLTYDSDVAAQLMPGGSVWTIWQGYYGSQERIVARLVKNKLFERFLLVAPEVKVAGHPQVVAFSEGDAWFFWTQFESGHWVAYGRHLTGGSLQERERLSPVGRDAATPVAIRSGAAGAIVAWQTETEGKMAIQVIRLTDGKWSEPETVSSAGFDAFRPTLVSAAGSAEAWVFWDEYRQPNYGVFGRRLSPDGGEIERISPDSSYAVKPQGLAAKSGDLWVTWVHVTDVVAADGVIDQSNQVQAAVRRDGRWVLQTDGGGKNYLASLDYGLLARMGTTVVVTGGYLGHRRNPMLLEAGDGIWLAYERKSDENGSTPNVTGDLVGRKFSGGSWGGLKTLAQGYVDYRSAGAADGKWIFTASQLPRHHYRVYQRFTVDPGTAGPAEAGEIEGWRPIALPLHPRPAVRPGIEEHGRPLHLYWLDSHVHSALTPDAEGEPDELLNYARDRSLLDVVVVQENDDMYDVPLSETKYATGTWLARWASGRPGQLALPGYEWTQIYPYGDADPARPFFWQSSFRNHRTVIYPLSGGPLVRYTDVKNDINRLYDAVRRAGGAVHTQHETFMISHDDVVEPAIEVTAGWGVYFLAPRRIHQALDAGYHKAFVGTSDSHRRNPGLGGGLTGVYAEDLTDAKILEAYRDRRVFATSGTRILIEARLNGVLMGREVPVAGAANVTLHVESPRAIRRAVLVAHDRDIKSFPGGGNTRLDVTYRDEAPAAGTTWYYWRVELEGEARHYSGNDTTAEGNLGWSSPMWAVKSK